MKNRSQDSPNFKFTVLKDMQLFGFAVSIKQGNIPTVNYVFGD